MGVPTPDVRLEPAVMGDIDRLVELWVALARDQRAYDSHLDPDTNRAAVRESLARHVVVDGVTVARHADDIVGFVMFGLEQGEYEQSVTRGVVHNLFVRHAWRDDGVGSRLLDRAESELVAAGADVVSLEAMAANRRARRFYERHGYRVHRVELEKPIEATKPARNDTHSKEDG
jgi:ribosomal protein S18 acetylase RimI-like enzyme